LDLDQISYDLQLGVCGINHYVQSA